MVKGDPAGDAEWHHLKNHHRDVTGGWLRPATFGVMDGLVSNFSLIAGVVGAGVATHTVVLTGLAGLAAGACSMASGEYISVKSQTELMRAEIAVEKRELDRHPELELAELTEIYRAKGLAPELAEEVARELTVDPEVRWRVHVREEMGVDPDDLPSPSLAAGSSFVAFAVGAVIPVVPFLLGATSILIALVLSVLTLATAGGIVARMTERPIWFGASRQVLFGAVSAAITFGIGLLIGTSV
ncbi:MAG: VIT1/CCC1 transporter family protein [Actinomycetia bacterium]|nr:VIT1/CCC1 transporter family protein [Actinomycetes bacterium]